MTRQRPLDPRAWLIWAIAASFPPLVGRNPWPLLATLLAVLGVWGVWGMSTAGMRWRPLLRLALYFGVISVLFNLLTAHVGDRVIGTLPAHWPVIGGPLTLNALLYGLLGALAIFSLVAVSATIGATLDWIATIRLLPERMAPLAVAGSVAWSYLPRTTTAIAEIREAQMARGYRPRGLRDAAPLIMPLLAGGLERSLITAEALEARAFGAPLSPASEPRPWQVALLLAGLVAALTGIFSLALGQIIPAAVLLTLAIAFLAIGLFLKKPIDRPLRLVGQLIPTSAHPSPGSTGRVPSGWRLGVRESVGMSGNRVVQTSRRTRYRDPIWERPEWVVSGTAATVLAVEIVVLMLDPTAFRYEPYPTLTAPAINLPLLAVLGLLLTPAAVRP